jgi:hypothetical protein
MKDAIKLIIVLVVVALIAFPVLAYMGFSPFAEYGLTIYTFISTKASTTFGTVYGLVGATGISAASAVALGFAYTQIKKQKTAITNWAQNTISSKDAAIEDLNGQTSTLTKASTVKDEAFTKLNTAHTELTTQYSGLQSKVASMEGQLKTQTDQGQALLTKNSALVNDAIKNKVPENTVFTNPSNPLEKLIVIKEKYIT